VASVTAWCKSEPFTWSAAVWEMTVLYLIISGSSMPVFTEIF